MKSGLFCVLSHRLIAPQYSRFNPYTFTEATIAAIRPHVFLNRISPVCHPQEDQRTHENKLAPDSTS